MPGFTTTLRNATLNAITTAAGNGAKLLLCGGTRPATGATTPTPLATLTCGSPFAGAASNGVLTLTAVGAATASAGGGAPGTVVSWARLTKSDNTFVADFSVTATAGGGELTMDNPAVQTGATITPGTITITDGNP